MDSAFINFNFKQDWSIAIKHIFDKGKKSDKIHVWFLDHLD